MQAVMAADLDDDHPILVRRLSRRQRIGLDAVLVFGYACALLMTGPAATAPAATTPSRTAFPWEQFILIAAATLPIAVRRIWPLPVFAFVLVVTVVTVVRDMMWDPFLPAAFAIYTVAVTVPPRRWWHRWLPALTVGLLALASVVGVVRAGQGFWWRGGPGLLLLGTVALLGAWQLGRAARQRRAFAIRAARQLASRAVDEERLRIARELHDVVTHSMGLIAVKAGVANHVVHSRPQEAYDALQVIEHTSRAALHDMRRMLGVLRTSDGERQPAARDPAPGTGELPELVSRAGAALTMNGVERLPDGVALAVHRIVQEALTNVAKHAPGARCEVVVGANGHQVTLDITDDGVDRPAATARPGGHGLVGMRERVAMYGGSFSAGPRPEGGFAVRACLPYEQTA